MIGIIAIIAKYVLPAYAGMIPAEASHTAVAGGAPRVCGDDPFLRLLDGSGVECSPRMRG